MSSSQSGPKLLKGQSPTFSTCLPCRAAQDLDPPRCCHGGEVGLTGERSAAPSVPACWCDLVAIRLLIHCEVLILLPACREEEEGAWSSVMPIEKKLPCCSCLVVVTASQSKYVPTAKSWKQSVSGDGSALESHSLVGISCG